MAMGLLRAKVEPQGTQWVIASAGTWGFDGDPAAMNAQLAMSEKGIDISEHRSRQVTHEMMAEFNLILTMERGHKEALQIEFPALASRVYLLSEMVDSRFDIDDPMGGSLDDFMETANELEQLISDGFERILELSADPVDVSASG